jgi:RHS repeat-associated protein
MRPNLPIGSLPFFAKELSMPRIDYLWDPLSDSVIMETDENGDVVATYNHEPDGRLISEHRDGVTYNHHYDGNGNTIALTDDSGNVTDTWAYSAFGNVVARTGMTPTPYQFGGEYGYQTDTLTDDIYVRARTYELTIGRWLSTDPIPDSMARSAYLYALNNPVNSSDPAGLFPMIEGNGCFRLPDFGFACRKKRDHIPPCDAPRETRVICADGTPICVEYSEGTDCKRGEDCTPDCVTRPGGVYSGICSCEERLK